MFETYASQRSVSMICFDRCVCCNAQCRSCAPPAADFRLRYVTLNLFRVGADNRADKMAAAIMNDPTI